MTDYSWNRGGFRFKQIDANVAGEALTKLHERNGALKPQVVVSEARKKNSPLHEAFEWDDKLAANTFRLDQAREMIRALSICVECPEGAPRIVHAFVHVPAAEDEDPKYLTIAALKAQPADYARALNYMLVMLEKLEQAVVQLREAASAVGVSKRKVTEVQRKGTEFREAVMALETFPDAPKTP